MTINNKKRAGLIGGLAILTILLIYLIGGHWFSARERLELQTFQAGDGWGYQIVNNGKVVIYQPMIPSIDSVMNFPSEESAQEIGTLVLNRMIEHKDFSITKEDIQHSLSYLGQ